MHHPDTLPQRDPRHRPARDGGPVDGFGHLEVVGSGDVLDDAVASIVPDIHSEGEVRLGFHGQGRLDSPWPAGIYTALLLRPEYISQNLDRALPTKDGGTLRTIGEAVQYMTGIGKKRELRSQWRRVSLARLMSHGLRPCYVTASRNGTIQPIVRGLTVVSPNNSWRR
jgi:hypothetical protein